MTEGGGKPGSRIGLSVTVRHLISIASLAALGREAELARYVRAALAAGVDASQIRETFLQVALLAGLPRAISGLETLQTVLAAEGKRAPAPPREILADTAALRTKGEEAFRKVYAGNADPVIERLAALHPLLADWVLSSAYGAVLARPALSLTLREYVSVAVLTVLDQPLQLMAHMRGAVAVGGSEPALREVLSQISLHLDEAQAARALRLLEKASL